MTPEAHGARLTAEWSPGRAGGRPEAAQVRAEVDALASALRLAVAVACAAVPVPSCRYRCGCHRGDARTDWQRVPDALICGGCGCRHEDREIIRPADGHLDPVLRELCGHDLDSVVPDNGQVPAREPDGGLATETVAPGGAGGSTPSLATNPDLAQILHNADTYRREVLNDPVLRAFLDDDITREDCAEGLP